MKRRTGSSVRGSDALSQSPFVHRKGVLGLALGAIGVVFGDIGTSPLYSLQTVFSLEHRAVKPTVFDVYGIISMVVWALIIVVTLKYVLLVMRADNDGEGGILALVALLQHRLRRRPRLALVAIMMGIVGAGLFYGDSMITPAISVMSAIEGLTVANPHLEEFVLPISVVILTGLFLMQRFGTHVVGRLFGPVMLLWFVVIAGLGVPHVLAHPEIVQAVSPHWAIQFAIERPFIAFVAMGAVVLTITGAEALYADMGHFGAGPIRLSWLVIILPALLINYFGQGAMIIHDPSTVDNPFFRMAPDALQLPLVILATVATVIASQAVISGAFSVSQQATRLALLPRMNIRHTHKEEGGQIYVPFINWVLFFGVILLISIFQSSARLATAYGLAVTGTLVLTTTLFLFLARYVWRWGWWRIVLIALVVGGYEATFLFANVAKLISGGWIPLVIATIVIVAMTTWRKGSQIVTQRRMQTEGPLSDFIDEMRTSQIRRVPGIAVFPHPNWETTPLALRQNVDFNQVLHEHVVIVTIVNENVPHVRHSDRVVVHDLKYSDDGIVHISCHVGFNDSQDVPKALSLAIGMCPELEGIDVDEAYYFLSVSRLVRGDDRSMRPMRKRLFLLMAQNAADRALVFRLPPQRSAVMGGQLEV